MERIESFRINHLVLEPGLYVSRRDEKNGVVVTTFDLRITTPQDICFSLAQNRFPG